MRGIFCSGKRAFLDPGLAEPNTSASSGRSHQDLLRKRSYAGMRWPASWEADKGALGSSRRMIRTGKKLPVDSDQPREHNVRQFLR